MSFNSVLKDKNYGHERKKTSNIQMYSLPSTLVISQTGSIANHEIIETASYRIVVFDKSLPKAQKRLKALAKKAGASGLIYMRNIKRKGAKLTLTGDTRFSDVYELVGTPVIAAERDDAGTFNARELFGLNRSLRKLSDKFRLHKLIVRSILLSIGGLSAALVGQLYGPALAIFPAFIAIGLSLRVRFGKWLVKQN